MPAGLTTVSADFFHLKGTAVISSGVPGYSPNTITAYEDRKDEETGEYIPTQIGATATIAALNSSWEIDLKGSVYTGGRLYFKVVSKAAGQPDQEFISPSYGIDSLMGEQTVTVTVYLFQLNNARAETTTLTSVTLEWDKADWATGGYRIYRNGTTTNLPQGTITYTDPAKLTPGTTYIYTIYAYVSGTDTERGTYTVYAHTKPTAPQNVKAELSASDIYPFQTDVSWDPVPPADGNISYIVYRNGEKIGETSSTYYPDYDYKTPEKPYSYEIAAVYYKGEGERSAKSGWVVFPLTDVFSPGSSNYVSGSGLLYYRLTVPSSGSYYIYLWESNIYYKGNTYGSSVSFNLKADEEVIVVAGTTIGWYSDYLYYYQQ
jgi:hypothetical protein